MSVSTDLTAMMARMRAAEQRMAFGSTADVPEPADLELTTQAHATIAGLLLGHVVLSDLGALPQDIQAAAGASMRKYRSASRELERAAAERDAARVADDLTKRIAFGLVTDRRLAKSVVDGMAAR